MCTCDKKQFPPNEKQYILETPRQLHNLTLWLQSNTNHFLKRRDNIEANTTTLALLLP